MITSEVGRAPPEGRGAVQDWVLATLRHALMSGQFLPGQVLSLRKLADSLGTSLTPVRESLSRLVAAHALVEQPNRTVCVPRLSVTSLEELFAVRVRIEGMAGALACGKATDDLIAALERHNDALQVALSDGDMALVLSCNQAFHFTLYEAANSEILMPLIEALWLRCGPTMYFSVNAPRNHWDTSHHIELLEAMRQGDSGKAEAAIAADIGKTGEDLIRRARSQLNHGPFASLPRWES